MSNKYSGRVIQVTKISHFSNTALVGSNITLTFHIIFPLEAVSHVIVSECSTINHGIFSDSSLYVLSKSHAMAENRSLDHAKAHTQNSRFLRSSILVASTSTQSEISYIVIR
jgi:hypothetical protein